MERKVADAVCDDPETDDTLEGQTRGYLALAEVISSGRLPEEARKHLKLYLEERVKEREHVVTSRRTSGSMDSPQEEGGEAAAGSDDGGESSEESSEVEGAVSDPTTMSRREWGELLIRELRRISPPPPSEDEMFLMCMLPMFSRLPPRTKETVKLRIHELLFKCSTANMEPVQK